MELKTETSGWIRNSITFKLMAIGFLVLILLIPTSMIQNLITERSKSHSEVKKEITDKWGANQIIGGPVLTLPYKKLSGIAGNQSEEIAYAHFLPEKLKIQGNIKPEIRSRGIYKVILYNSDLVLSGLFLKPDINFLNVPEENILWDEAFVTIGIPDLRGIKRLINIEWNDESYIGKPGVINRDIFESGIHSKIPINPDSGAYNFSLKLDINGSENIGFLPFGKETHVNIESSWKSPSFSGAFLPENREITVDGFKADWNILSLNRNYPQSWTGVEKKAILESAFGLELLLPVDHYQKSTRSAKYAVMFLFLTFMIFFVNEMINKSKIHPVQYLMIGMALVIFYTLLISLSEYFGFNFAYTIASALTISLITGYSFNILKRKAVILTGVFLIILYGFLFVLLQMETFSLLFGSFGLFILLAVAMFATRKVDWYSPLRNKNENQ